MLIVIAYDWRTGNANDFIDLYVYPYETILLSDILINWLKLQCLYIAYFVYFYKSKVTSIIHRSLPVIVESFSRFLLPWEQPLIFLFSFGSLLHLSYNIQTLLESYCIIDYCTIIRIDTGHCLHY